MQSSIVQKLLAVLGVISAAPKPLTFSEIVNESGLNKSTIHRLLSIGTQERLVRFDARDKTYVLGSTVFDLVRNAHTAQDIQSIALDDMVTLFDQVDANVTIGVPSGLEVVYLRILEAPHAMGGMQRPGMREPVHCSASGKALLAYLPEQVIAAKLKGYDFQRFTERTITNAQDFADELAFVRAHGFGKNDREKYDQFLGISAPVFDYIGEPTAVLNIWSVYPRHTLNDLMEWGDALKNAAANVTRLIDGVMPDRSDFRSS